MTGVFIWRDPETQIHPEKRPSNAGSGSCREAATSRGTPRMAGDPQKPHKARENSSLEPSEGVQPYWHLAVGCLGPTAVRKCFFCFKSLNLWQFIMAILGNYTSPQYLKITFSLFLCHSAPIFASPWIFVCLFIITSIRHCSKFCFF